MSIQDLIDDLKRVSGVIGSHAPVRFSDEDEGVIRNNAGTCEVGCGEIVTSGIQERVDELEGDLEDEETDRKKAEEALRAFWRFYDGKDVPPELEEAFEYADSL